MPDVIVKEAIQQRLNKTYFAFARLPEDVESKGRDYCYATKVGASHKIKPTTRGNDCPCHYHAVTQWQASLAR